MILMCCPWCANRVYQLYLICGSTCSVRMVWTLHIAYVFLFAISKFFHFSWIPICDTETRCPNCKEPWSLLHLVWFCFCYTRRLTNAWVHKQTNILPIAIFCISSLIVINVCTTEMYWLLKQRDFHGWQNYNNKRSAGNCKQEVSLYV